MGFTSGALAAGKGLHDDMLGAVDDDLCGLHLAHPLVVQDTVLGTQDPQLAGAEGLAAVAQLRQLCQRGGGVLRFQGVRNMEQVAAVGHTGHAAHHVRVDLCGDAGAGV